MWKSKYSPRNYVERHKSLPVVLSRSYGPARNDNTYRSTYGVWNDNYGLRCGLWDDVLFRSSGRGNGGSRTAIKKGNVSRPISQLLSPRRQFRFQVLATPKKDGCGPNCKKSRCAATEHPKPFCEADKRERNGPKRIGTSASPATVKNTYTTIANVQDRILDDGKYNITMGLRNLKKVNELGDLEDLPIVELNCGECSDPPRETLEAGADTPESGSGARDNGLKSLITTRTVASNKEQHCEREVHEIPVRVLRDVNNNIIPERLHKTTSPFPKMKIPIPIQRVALLRPPKPTEPNKTSTPQQSSNQPSKKSSKQSSKADSLISTASDCETSSCTTKGASTRFNNDSIPKTLTPMYCLCSLSSKSESFTDTSHINSAVIYRNNPLYSPPQSLTRTTDLSPGASARWRLISSFLEVLVLVVLGGVLTLGLIPYVESAFRAYVADFCRCTGTGKGAGVRS